MVNLFHASDDAIFGPGINNLYKAVNFKVMKIILSIFKLFGNILLMAFAEIAMSNNISIFCRNDL